MTPDAHWFHAAALGLGLGALLASGVWAVSVAKRDVSIVDSAWGLLVLAPALVIVAMLPHSGPRASVVLTLAVVWALRLSLHIAWRHRGQPEDRRYQAIRTRNEPHFAWKSLYLVFGLQALLAWIVAAPLMATVASLAPWNALDALGLALAVFGLLFETVADAQLSRFRADARNRGQVMDRGLWRFSRHPNYFGELSFWFSMALFGVGAAPADWWWLFVGVVAMLAMFLGASIPLMEKRSLERRPHYQAVIDRVSRLVPRPPKAAV